MQQPRPPFAQPTPVGVPPQQPGARYGVPPPLFQLGPYARPMMTGPPPPTGYYPQHPYQQPMQQQQQAQMQLPPQYQPPQPQQLPPRVSALPMAVQQTPSLGGKRTSLGGHGTGAMVSGRASLGPGSINTGGTTGRRSIGGRASIGLGAVLDSGRRSSSRQSLGGVNDPFVQSSIGSYITLRARRSSLAGQAAKFPMDIRDKDVKRRLAKSVVSLAAELSYPQELSIKTWVTAPSSAEFVKLFQFFCEQLDPRYLLSPNFDQSHIYLFMSLLKYPYLSDLQRVKSIKTLGMGEYNYLLAMMAWLCDLIRVHQCWLCPI